MSLADVGSQKQEMIGASLKVTSIFCSVTESYKMQNVGIDKRLVIGVSGASGAGLAFELLKQLQGHPEWETHLVLTSGARRTISLETDHSVDEFISLATKNYALDDIGASISSGTFKTEGMVIVPWSMKTLAERCQRLFREFASAGSGCDAERAPAFGIGCA